MSQDKALEGSNLRDKLKAINTSIAAHIATADAVNAVGGAPVRHSDEETTGQVKKTTSSWLFCFQNAAQVGGGEVDSEVVDHLDHAKRLVSSCSAPRQEGLCST